MLPLGKWNNPPLCFHSKSMKYSVSPDGGSWDSLVVWRRWAASHLIWLCVFCSAGSSASSISGKVSDPWARSSQWQHSSAGMSWYEIITVISLKVAYLTVIFPYVLQVILFTRAATLPGASDGIKHYLIPQLSRLANLGVNFNSPKRIHCLLRSWILGSGVQC